jgi:hypothetical protein
MKIHCFLSVALLIFAQSAQAREPRVQGWWAPTQLLEENLDQGTVVYDVVVFFEEWEEGSRSRSCVYDVSHLTLRRSIIQNGVASPPKLWYITPGTVDHNTKDYDCNKFEIQDRAALLAGILGNYAKWRSYIDPDLESIKAGKVTSR